MTLFDKVGPFVSHTIYVTGAFVISIGDASNDNKVFGYFRRDRIVPP